MSELREDTTMSAFDWREFACQLPVVRKHWNDPADDFAVAVEPCGEQLFVTYEEGKYFLMGGEVDSCGPTWKVECGNGHVLFVPDHGGDDRFADLPFDEKAAMRALEAFTGPGKDSPA